MRRQPELGPADGPPPWDEPPHAAGRLGIGQKWRRIVLVIVLLVMPLITGELAVRSLIGMDRLPVARAHLRDFEIMWANLHRGPAPDLLILGDSVSQQDIDPAILASSIESAVGEKVRTFDAASAGAGFRVNEAVVRQLALENRLPRVAIIGIQPGTIEGGDDADASFFASPMGQLLGGCGASADAGRWLDCELGSASALWRWRGTPGRVLAALQRPQPTTSRSNALLLREDGFRVGDPRPEARIRQQVSRWVAGEPAELRVDPAVLSAYRDLVQLLVRNGVAVVPVALPENPLLTAALVARTPQWEASRRAAVSAFEASTGVAAVHVDAFGPWYTDGSSRDAKHLSGAGAAQLTGQLWQMPDFRTRILAALGPSSP